MKKICVIGSLNVDLTVRLPRFHAPGETITGLSFDTYAGGKGGNQAVAASTLGHAVSMVGRLGADGNGDFYRRVLKEKGIDDSLTHVAPDVPTGIALIEVDAQGENRIAIVPGANAALTPIHIDEILPTLLQCDFFLLQLEIPLPVVCHAAALLHAHEKCVILDPAPACELPPSLISSIDYITPNATELSLLTGLPVSTQAEAELAAKALLEKGAKAVVAKLGSRGCLYVDAHRSVMAPGFSVEAVDTTAAGDSFNAGLAVALAQGMPIEKALQFANAVGALSTTGAGAQQAMPTLSRVQKLINEAAPSA